MKCHHLPDYFYLQNKSKSNVLNCLAVNNEFFYYLPFPYKYIRPSVINKGCQLNSRFGFSVHAKPFLK